MTAAAAASSNYRDFAGGARPLLIERRPGQRLKVRGQAPRKPTEPRQRLLGRRTGRQDNGDATTRTEGGREWRREREEMLGRSRVEEVEKEDRNRVNPGSWPWKWGRYFQSIANFWKQVCTK